jgi:hypothetical protein
MDENPRHFDKTIRQLLEMLRDLIESHLAMLFRRFNDIHSLEFILNNLDNGIIVHDLERTILFLQ